MYVSFLKEMIGSSDSFTNLVFTNPPIFFTKFAACFDFLKTDFCLGIKISMQNNAKIIIHLKEKDKKNGEKKTEIDRIRETV